VFIAAFGFCKSSVKKLTFVFGVFGVLFLNDKNFLTV
jgi:hypothetical protein